MSSTLSEGVRVPDIGSTSWGADVNFNWGLLNTALANISGNVKTDVANTWTAPQTFTETISGSIDGVAARAVGDEDGNNIKTALATKAADSAVVHLAGAETITGNKTFTGINDFKTLRLYGTASNNLVAYTPSGVKGDSSTFGLNVICSDQNLGSYAASGVANIGMGQSGGTSYVALNASTIGSADHNTHSIQVGLQIAASDNANIGSFYPSQNNGINLGTSTNQWKTLNGINPGALGLQNFNAEITLDTTNWDKTGEWGASANFWTPTVNGWLSVLVNGTPGAGWVQLSQADNLGQFSVCLSTGYAWATIPVVANRQCKICLLCSTVSAKFFPCQGNV